MHYGFVTPNWGDYGDPRLLAELACEAEATGWEGFFIWDHIKWPAQDPTADPWVALAAMAMRTERIRLGTMVTPLPRRRPWKLARETLTLDQLSGGRLILGVGSGYFMDEEFAAFGEETDAKIRAAKLDEGLEVLTGLWSGELFSYAGTQYQVKNVCFTPPVQRPRIPIWVAGTWPMKAPFRRAARWDGVVPVPRDSIDSPILTPREIRDIVAYIREHRTRADPFEIANSGQTQGGGVAEDAAIVAPYVEAGATWWLEYRFPWLSPLTEVRQRIRKGPPRV
jgi:alkanesulfonate monooxygenase SsuD/methylene tetrahydromethanopterin reductase-like flavin-dependent oxidoreductase (luciferase family)